MNDVQRASIKFKTEQVHSNGKNITDAFYSVIRARESVTGQVTLTPEEVLTQRLKITLLTGLKIKVLRHVEQLFNQQEQVEHYLD